jgi:NifB/MoaA-like Fe-S oxidoreductase
MMPNARELIEQVAQGQNPEQVTRGLTEMEQPLHPEVAKRYHEEMDKISKRWSQEFGGLESYLRTFAIRLTASCNKTPLMGEAMTFQAAVKALEPSVDKVTDAMYSLIHALQAASTGPK